MNSKAYKVVVTATNGRPMVIAFPSGHYAGLGSSGLLVWKGNRGVEIPLLKRKTIGEWHRRGLSDEEIRLCCQKVQKETAKKDDN